MLRDMVVARKQVTEDNTKNIYAITSSDDENKPAVNVCKKSLPKLPEYLLQKIKIPTNIAKRKIKG